MFRVLELPLETREATPDDLAFIFDSWLESYRLSHAAGVIPMDMYRSLYREIISRVVMRSKAMVVYNVEAPQQLLAHMVYEIHEGIPIVHYIFTKAFIRRLGLARELLKAAGIDPMKLFLYPFKSRVAGAVNQRWLGGRFDPITVRRLITVEEEAHAA